MKIPFISKRETEPVKPLDSRSVKASAFFANASVSEKEVVFSGVIKKVNKEQKEVVRKFGKTFT